MEEVEREILEICGVSSEVIDDAKRIRSLEENVYRSWLTLTRECNAIRVHLSFSEPVKTQEEFEKYLKRNNIKDYKIGVTRSETEDYFITLNSGMEIEFYNPNK